jgi:multiple sugar transport system permease protein
MNNILVNPLKKLYAKLKDLLSTPKKRKYFASKCINVFFNVVKYIFLIGISFIVLYPLILQLAVAFRMPTDVSNPEVMWIPEHFSIENFKIAMKALNYWEALGTTFFNSLVVSLLQVAATACAGYAFARLKFRGRKVLFFLSLFTIIVPQTMVSLPMYINFAKAGLLGKKYVLFLMSGLGMGIKSGIFIYLFRQSFKGLPKELEEAAYMDGCNVFQVFIKVMFPLK